MSVWICKRHEGGTYGEEARLKPVQRDVALVCRLGVDGAHLRPNLRLNARSIGSCEGGQRPHRASRSTKSSRYERHSNP